MLILLAMPRSEEAKGCLKILKSAEHTIDQADHGGKALDMTSKDKYDLLITAEDFGRDRMNGADLVEHIRTREVSGHLRRLPIIMLSVSSKKRIDADIVLPAPLEARDMEIISHFNIGKTS